MAKLLQKPRTLLPPESEEFDVLPASMQVNVSSPPRGSSKFTSNADGSESYSGVTGLNLYGPGVFVDTPVGGVQGVYVPGALPVYEVYGGNAGTYSILSTYSTIQPSGAGSFATSVPAGKSMICANVGVLSGSASNDDIRIQLVNLTTGTVIPFSEMRLGNFYYSFTAGFGQVEINKMINVSIPSLIGVQVVNNTSARGTVYLANSNIQAIVLPSASWSVQQLYLTLLQQVGSSTSWLVSGGGLSQSVAVYFNGVNATSFVVNSDSQITAVNPLGFAPTSVVVQTAQGTTASVAPWTPTSITGCQLWLAANSLALSDGANVTGWVDGSSNGWTYAPNGYSEGQTAPIFKTNIQNGLPVVRFTNSSTAGISTPHVLSLTGMSLFLVWKPVIGSVLNSLLYCGSSGISGNNGFVAYLTAPGVFSFQESGFTTYTGPSYAAYSGAWHQFEFIGATSGNSAVYADGIALSTSMSAITSNSPSLQTSLGYATSNGAAPTYDIGEMIVYSGALTVVQRQQVEAYLRGKWGTP